MLTEANGLLYMRARYYSPDLMRFINEDIVTGDISNSNSLNRYSYVEGNPVTMVDPFGLCGRKTEFKNKSVLERESIAYILYIDDFEEQACKKGEKLEKKGFDVYYVDLYEKAMNNQPSDVINSDMQYAREFIYQWNNVIPQDVDAVYIFSHGSERMLQFREGSGYNAITTNGLNKAGKPVAGDFDCLNAKSVDELYLIACNTGVTGMSDHTCDIHDGTNPAMCMSEKIDGLVYAWDGSVSFNKITQEPRLSFNQEHFNDEIIGEALEWRLPKGLVVYSEGVRTR